MKKLQDFTVKKGKTEERVRITLETEDAVLQAWLDPEQAERLAADILSCRFAFPVVIIDPPKRKRRGPVYLVFKSEPRELGARPSLSEETLDWVERTNPTIRAKVKTAQEKWDRRAARRRAKPGTPQSGFFSDTRKHR
jgi:hypothetical protein